MTLDLLGAGDKCQFGRSCFDLTGIRTAHLPHGNPLPLPICLLLPVNIIWCWSARINHFLFLYIIFIIISIIIIIIIIVIAVQINGLKAMVYEPVIWFVYFKVAWQSKCYRVFSTAISYSLLALVWEKHAPRPIQSISWLSAITNLFLTCGLRSAYQSAYIVRSSICLWFRWFRSAYVVRPMSLMAYVVWSVICFWRVVSDWLT